MRIFMFLYNYFIVLINVLNASRYFRLIFCDYFESELFRDYTFYAFLMIIFTIVLIVIFPTTDQLKYPSYFGGFILFLILIWLWVKCFVQGFENVGEMEVFTFNFPPFVGAYTYCILCVGCLVSGNIKT